MWWEIHSFLSSNDTDTLLGGGRLKARAEPQLLKKNTMKRNTKYQSKWIRWAFGWNQSILLCTRSSRSRSRNGPIEYPKKEERKAQAWVSEIHGGKKVDVLLKLQTVEWNNNTNKLLLVSINGHTEDEMRWDGIKQKRGTISTSGNWGCDSAEHQFNYHIKSRVSWFLLPASLYNLSGGGQRKGAVQWPHPHTTHFLKWVLFYWCWQTE